jgi:hypothetical protein
VDSSFTKKSNGKRKTEAHAIILKAFTVCSLCRRKFVVCPFVDEETSGSYSFANGLNKANGLNRMLLCNHCICTFRILWYFSVFLTPGSQSISLFCFTRFCICAVYFLPIMMKQSVAEYGTNRKPWFCFTPSYWMSATVKKVRIKHI